MCLKFQDLVYRYMRYVWTLMRCVTHTHVILYLQYAEIEI